MRALLQSPPGRALLYGAAALLVQLALGIMLVLAGLAVPWLAFGLLSGLALGYWVARPWPGLRRWAITAMTLAGLTGGMTVEVPPWGEAVELRGAGELPRGQEIAGYRLPDWRIRTDRAFDEPLTASKSTRIRGHRRIAPLVPPGWTPEQPVTVWVVGETSITGRMVPNHPDFWRRPGEFVRVIGREAFVAEATARRATPLLELRAAASPLIVRWVGSVEHAVATQRRVLFGAVALWLAVWLLSIPLACGLSRWRERRAARRAAAAIAGVAAQAAARR